MALVSRRLLSANVSRLARANEPRLLGCVRDRTSLGCLGAVRVRGLPLLLRMLVDFFGAGLDFKTDLRGECSEELPEDKADT